MGKLASLNEERLWAWHQFLVMVQWGNGLVPRKKLQIRQDENIRTGWKAQQAEEREKFRLKTTECLKKAKEKENMSLEEVQKIIETAHNTGMQQLLHR